MKKMLAFLTIISLIVAVMTVQLTLADAKQGTAGDRTSAVGTFKDQDLVGLKVQNARGEDLGRISSLVIDPKDGRVAFAVLTYGGFWGFRANYVAVPLPVMDLKTDKNGRPNAFVLDMSKQQLASAPIFSGNGMPDEKQVEDSYRFFGETPYWTDKTDRAGDHHHGFDFSIHIGAGKHSD